MFPLYHHVWLAAILSVTLSQGRTFSQETCQQGVNCHLPDCFCPTLEHPLGSLSIPQIVYFGFDDAVQPVVSSYYDQIFTANRKNPNGCPITMSLYVSHEYTDYSLVADYYKKGNEIAPHSVTHTDIDTAAKLRKEGAEQKENIEKLANIPPSDVIGWRSPNLKTAGDDQPIVLQELQYWYDISLTYNEQSSFPFPFTLDYGYPFACVIPPCPSPTTPHKGFWEVMVHTYYDPKTGLPCSYIDGCRPDGEEAALDFLWANFLKNYESNRSPFGLNMHAAWFATPDYLKAMQRFVDGLLDLEDVYIVNVRQMLDWMKNPVTVSEAKTFAPWGCSGVKTSSTGPASKTKPRTPIPIKTTFKPMTYPSRVTRTPDRSGSNPGSRILPQSFIPIARRHSDTDAGTMSHNKTPVGQDAKVNPVLTWLRQYKEQQTDSSTSTKVGPRRYIPINSNRSFLRN